MNLYNILMSDDIVKSIENNISYLTYIIPEIKATFNFNQMHPHHHLDLWHHIMYALSLSPKDYEVRITLLLHDIGKPYSYIEKDGIRHYPNHAEVSAIMTKTILNRLNFDINIINRVVYLVRYHDTPITENDIKFNYELSYKRFIVQECDALAHNPTKLEKRIKYLNKTKELLK